MWIVKSWDGKREIEIQMEIVEFDYFDPVDLNYSSWYSVYRCAFMNSSGERIHESLKPGVIHKVPLAYPKHNCGQLPHVGDYVGVYEGIHGEDTVYISKYALHLFKCADWRPVVRDSLKEHYESTFEDRLFHYSLKP